MIIAILVDSYRQLLEKLSLGKTRRQGISHTRTRIHFCIPSKARMVRSKLSDLVRLNAGIRSILLMGFLQVSYEQDLECSRMTCHSSQYFLLELVQTYAVDLRKLTATIFLLIPPKVEGFLPNLRMFKNPQTHDMDQRTNTARHGRVRYSPKLLSMHFMGNNRSLDIRRVHAPPYLEGRPFLSFALSFVIQLSSR